MQFFVRSTALLATTLALAGCGFFGTGSEEKFPPICPGLSLLDDASDITRYVGDGRDITQIVLDGRITAVPAQCTRDAKNVVKTVVQVKASVTRGPAASGRQANLGYVITVVEGAQIIDQQDYAIATAFPPNVDRIDISGPPITLLFPVSAQKQASAYKIYVGLRLTPDELAENRKRGPR